MPKKSTLVTRTASPGDAVSEAISLITDLGAECREVADNMPESLQSTSRYEALDSSASTLEDLEEPDTLEWLPGACTWQEPRPTKRQPGRAARCSNAVNILSTVVEYCDELIVVLNEMALQLEDDEDDASEALVDSLAELEEYRDALQQIVDDAEGCEFPGMYG